MKKVILRTALLAAFLALFSGLWFLPKAHAADGGKFNVFVPVENQWYGFPKSLAVDNDGNIFFSGNGINEYDKNGKFIREIIYYGEKKSELAQEAGIATDKSGNLYVYNYGKACVVKYNKNGKYIKKWGSSGKGNGQFGGWHGTDEEGVDQIAIDAAGHVLVTDMYNNRIQEFTSDGKFIKKWGSKGTGNGQFNKPCGIEIDVAGNIYIADRGNHRIQKFDKNGKFLLKWGVYGYGEGQFYEPGSIVIGKSGNLFITDSYLNRIHVFKADGTFVQDFQIPYDMFSTLYGLALSADGNILAAIKGYASGGVPNRVAVYDEDWKLIKKWQCGGSEDGFIFNPVDVVTDSQGNLYVADNGNREIRKFGANGSFKTRWPLIGAYKTVSYEDYVHIAIDSKDNIYVTNPNNNRVVKYDSNGNALLKWGSKGTGNGQFQCPYYITVDASDRIYVSDDSHGTQVFDNTGKFIKVLKSADGKKINGQVVFDKNGNLFTMGTCKLYKYNTQLKLVKTWGDMSQKNGHIYDFFNLTVDNAGYVYIADEKNRIQVFDNNCKLITRWGSGGFLPDQFDVPSALCIDSHNGAFYVADCQNNRIMRRQFAKPVIKSVTMVPAAAKGYKPGRGKLLKVKSTLVSAMPTSWSMVVYNEAGQWVASVGTKGAFSGTKTFAWDGKATTGNAAGYKAGAYVPRTKSGTTYKMRIRAENTSGVVYTNDIVFKVYAG